MEIYTSFNSKIVFGTIARLHLQLYEFKLYNAVVGAMNASQKFIKNTSASQTLKRSRKDGIKFATPYLIQHRKSILIDGKISSTIG